MLKIYLSGAITGREAEAKKEFAEAEKSIKNNLIDYGFQGHEFEIKNPFKILKLNKKHKYEDYLRADIKVLCDCDYLVNIRNEGWEKSKGAKLEKQIAKALNIPNLLYISQIKKSKIYKKIKEKRKKENRYK